MFSRRWLRFVSLTVVLWLAAPALAQTVVDADRLNAEVMRLYRKGSYAEAVSIAERVLAIREKTLGLDHPDVGKALNNLAALYTTQGRYSDAEPLYKRTITILEKALGPEHPDVGKALGNLAGLYRDQGRYGDAETLYTRSVSIREKALGPDHPDVVPRGGASSLRGQRRKLRYVKEMFETAQWGVSSEAAASLAQSAARSAGGSPGLAALMRERQDLVAEWLQLDKLLISSKSRPLQRRNRDAKTALSQRL
jgi:tetratricopeptide (TPR) repeat protein